MRTSTLPQWTIGEGSILRSIPALNAGLVVLLFLVGSLLPLIACVLLVFMQICSSVLLLSSFPKKQRNLVIKQHISDVGLLLLALTVSLYLDPSVPWVTSLHGVTQLMVMAIALFGIVLPKAQFLRQALSREKTLHPTLSYFEILLSVGFLLLSPVFLHLSTTQIVEIIRSNVLSWRF